MSGSTSFPGRWTAIAFAGAVIWFAAAVAENPPKPADHLIARSAAKTTAAPTPDVADAPASRAAPIFAFEPQPEPPPPAPPRIGEVAQPGGAPAPPHQALIVH